MNIVKKLKYHYNIAKNKKIGECCVCPSCGTKFIKKSYQQVFCKSKSGTECKDFYWNNVDLKKRNNTTRISPANAAYMEKYKSDKEFNPDNDEHPFSSEALGQWDD